MGLGLKASRRYLIYRQPSAEWIQFEYIMYWYHQRDFLYIAWLTCVQATRFFPMDQVVRQPQWVRQTPADPSNQPSALENLYIGDAQTTLYLLCLLKLLKSGRLRNKRAKKLLLPMHRGLHELMLPVSALSQDVGLHGHYSLETHRRGIAALFFVIKKFSSGGWT